MRPGAFAILRSAILPAGVPLAWRQLTARRLRFAAAVAGISFASVMMLMQLGFHDALYDSVILPHRGFSGELVIISREYDYLADARTFARVRLAQARAVPGVAAALALHTALASWKNPDNLHDRTIFVIGCDAADPPLKMLGQGALIDVLHRPDQVLFDEASRHEFGRVADRFHSGETLSTEISGRKVTVGGIFRLGTSFASDGNVLMGESAFFRVLPQRIPGTVSLGIVRLEPGANPVAVRAALEQALPDDVLVLTREGLMAREKDYWARRTPIGFVISAGMIIGFIVGAVIVYQILYTDLSDHLKEYAVLKATGCSDAFLHGVVVLQSIILAVAGFVPAAALSWCVFLATRIVTSLPAYLDVSKSVIVLGMTLTMCLVSGACALRVLRQADPADVF